MNFRGVLTSVLLCLSACRSFADVQEEYRTVNVDPLVRRSLDGLVFRNGAKGEGSPGGLGDSGHSPCLGTLFRALYEDPRDKRTLARVEVVYHSRLDDASWLMHDVEGILRAGHRRGEIKLRQIGKRYVLQNQRNDVAWVAADAVTVVITRGGRDFFPDEMVRAYLDRVPSVLSATHKPYATLLDYVKRDVDKHLAMMDPAPTLSRRAYHFRSAEEIMKTGLLKPTAQEIETQDARRMMRELRAYWAKNRATWVIPKDSVWGDEPK